MNPLLRRALIASSLIVAAAVGALVVFAVNDDAPIYRAPAR